MKKKYTIRLQGIHDADLINLIKNYDVEARALFKICLLKYIQKEENVFNFSKINKNYTELKSIGVQIEFDDSIEEEINAIEFLDSIKPRYKNVCMKNIVRRYVQMPITSHFIENEEVADFIDSYYEETKKECIQFPVKKRKRPSETIETSKRATNYKKKQADSEKLKKQIVGEEAIIDKNEVKNPKKAKSFRILEEKPIDNTPKESISVEKADNGLISMFDGLF